MKRFIIEAIKLNCKGIIELAKKNQENLIQNPMFADGKIMVSKCKMHNEIIGNEEILALNGEVLLNISISFLLILFLEDEISLFEASQKAFTDCKAMTSVDLSKNKLNDEGANRIANYLMNKHNVISLSLSIRLNQLLGGNKIGSEGAKSLFQALLENDSLFCLDLS